VNVHISDSVIILCWLYEPVVRVLQVDVNSLRVLGPLERILPIK
jgi:hypothetical protein